jgi:hypothetical protein
MGVNSANWKGYLFLSIILPVSLLTAFKLTGTIGSAAVVETSTLNPVDWHFPRPTEAYDINNTLTASHSSNELSLNTSILLTYYSKAASHDDNDFMGMWLFISSAVNSNGFVQSVDVQFHEDPQRSIISWHPAFLTPENLSIQRVNYGWINEAYISLTNPNRTRDISFSGSADWCFLTPPNVTHQMLVTYEITYYNGTVFKRVIQPFQLKLDASLHILTLRALLPSPSGEPQSTNVTVWVNGTSYTTPVSLFLPEGQYTLSWKSPIIDKSNKYYFDIWHSGLYSTGNLTFISDMFIDGLYEASPNG